jgi:RHS repeat-associated protein
VLNSTGGEGIDIHHGFAGEWVDATGLIHLRARYYDPRTGRLITRDNWQGYAQRPISQNKWVYGYANPVFYTDPTGNDPIAECVALIIAFAVADGPLPAGEVIGVAACVALLGAASVSAIIAAQYAEEFGQAVETVTDQCTWTWEKILSLPESSPEPKPKPKTVPFPPLPLPHPTPRPEKCKPQAFIGWWNSLPIVPGTNRAGEDWYEYEQRVARESGLLGNHARRVSTGPIDVDGIKPSSCMFIDAKYSPIDVKSQFRPGGPPWIAKAVLDEFMYYHNAVVTRNNVPNAQPKGLIVRTNQEDFRIFFEQILQQAGFLLGLNGKVEIIP